MGGSAKAQVGGSGRSMEHSGTEEAKGGWVQLHSCAVAWPQTWTARCHWRRRVDRRSSATKRRR